MHHGGATVEGGSGGWITEREPWRGNHGEVSWEMRHGVAMAWQGTAREVPAFTIIGVRGSSELDMLLLGAER